MIERWKGNVGRTKMLFHGTIQSIRGVIDDWGWLTSMLYVDSLEIDSEHRGSYLINDLF